MARTISLLGKNSRTPNILNKIYNKNWQSTKNWQNDSTNEKNTFIIPVNTTLHCNSKFNHRHHQFLFYKSNETMAIIFTSSSTAASDRYFAKPCMWPTVTMGPRAIKALTCLSQQFHTNVSATNIINTVIVTESSPFICHEQIIKQILTNTFQYTMPMANSCNN